MSAARTTKVHDRGEKIQNYGRNRLLKICFGRRQALHQNETDDCGRAGDWKNESVGTAKIGGYHEEEIRGLVSLITFVGLIKRLRDFSIGLKEWGTKTLM